MPIEKENLACEGVVRPTEERITQFVDELNFLGPVSRGLERIWKGQRKITTSQMKKIDTDVQAVVEHLKVTLGATWAQASVARAQNNSKLVNTERLRGVVRRVVIPKMVVTTLRLHYKPITSPL